MSIFDNLSAQNFKTQFPRFTPQYLSDITYVQDKVYFKDNVVYYSGQFYICTVEQTTSIPTDANKWAIYDDSVLNYTQDQDILNAYAEAKVNFNESLFKDETTALMVFLYLAAHYLTVDFNNALGISSIGIATSKSVGSVSESYTIPQWLTDSPALGVYATTPYGVKYASLIRPYLIGNVMLFRGGITVS